MRHRIAGRKLNRTTSHREAMFRNMVTSLFEHGRIETTDPKAKELRKLADKMITLAKRGDLHARRQAMSVIRSKAVTHKLFTEIREKFLNREGGYTRVLKKGFRVGDGAPVSIIELVGAEAAKPKKVAKKAKGEAKAKKKEAAAAKPEKAKAEKAEAVVEKPAAPAAAEAPAPVEPPAEPEAEAPAEAKPEASAPEPEKAEEAEPSAEEAPEEEKKGE